MTAAEHIRRIHERTAEAAAVPTIRTDIDYMKRASAWKTLLHLRAALPEIADALEAAERMRQAAVPLAPTGIKEVAVNHYNEALARLADKLAEGQPE